MANPICLIIILFSILQTSSAKLKSDAPLKLCCDINYYLDAKGFSCLPSNETLLPTFYHQDGTPAEGFFMKNVTAMNNCEAYQLQSSEFVLQTDGSLIVGSKDKSKTYIVKSGSHCLLWMKIKEDFPFSALICFPERKSASSSNFYDVTHGIILPAGMGISAFFLLATFLLYCFIPELRDQLGKSFMCSIACLCLSKVLAIIIKTSSKELPSWLCIFSGLVMHVCFLQAFFWLNVISILVFVSLWLRGKKFCLDANGGFIASCLYAFGVPTVILIIVILHDFSTALDGISLPTPGFGVGSCWFSNRGAQLVYFYAPIAILVGTNVILFCLSACKLWSLSSTTFSFHFKQYLKLFLLMGVSWIFEVLSFFFGTPHVPSAASYIWFILDLFNALSGVFIFIFFACKRTALERAYAIFRGKETYDKRFAMSFNADELSKAEGTNQDVKLVKSDDSPKKRMEP